MWKHLDDYQIILGSQSPRRVELLRGLDLPFEQIRLEVSMSLTLLTYLSRRSPSISPA